MSESNIVSVIHDRWAYSGRGALSEFVKSEEGGQAQRKIWGELLAKLERVVPGISDNAGVGP